MNAMRLTSTAPSLRQHSGTPRERLTRPSHVVVETCVENVEGVRISARAGADRAELCDNLVVGGTTPSIGAVEAAIFAAAEEVEQHRALAGPRWFESAEAVPFGLRVMVRPRGGSFVFDADERHAMIADVRRVAALAREMSEYTRPQRTGGSRGSLPPAVELGFVIGVLTDEQVVDRGLLRLLIDVADGAPITFSRALDQTRDLVEAYGDLGGLGVDHVLTSGGAPTALEGADVLRGLVAGGGPRVIAVGTVRPENVAEVVTRADVSEVHLRCSVPGSTPERPQRTDESRILQAVQTARSLELPGSTES